MNPTPRAAIIGLGSIYPMHEKSLITLGIPIAAVCDKDEARVLRVAESLNARGYINYKDMLNDGGFDVLHICLPHFLHAPITIDALRANYHVLCEKPLATTVKDAQEMIKTANESKKALSVVFQNRYNPGVQLIKKAITESTLGKIIGGFFRVTWHRGENYYANSDWRGAWATEGGGALINQAIHLFDMMNFFLGKPHHVNASISNRAHPTIEVEDIAEGIIFYGKNGEIPISFYVNTFHPYDAPITLELIGENGHATLIGEDATIQFKDGTLHQIGADIDAQKKFNMKTYWGVSHIKQITDFYETIKKSTAVGFNDETALFTQRLINDVYTLSKNQLHPLLPL